MAIELAEIDTALLSSRLDPMECRLVGMAQVAHAGCIVHT